MSDAEQEEETAPQVEEEPAKIDFRTKQIEELEKLQETLDQNNVLRATFNALQTQVVPLTDSFGAGPQTVPFQSERVYTPEEIEAMKQKLEQTLSDYREETRIAGRLNSEIEKKYTELSSLRMKFRLDQDERLTKQNQSSAQGLANFRSKTMKVAELNNIEKQRLTKAIEFLKGVYETSSSDIQEFEEQSRSNNKGIAHLSSSITIAREDIRDFTDQLQKIEPKLKEYEELKRKHEQSEEQVVQLSDQYESLKKQVETESLTANIRRQIDFGNRTIADLNRSIDQVIGKNSQTQDKVKDAKSRISEIETKLEKTRAETAELVKAKVHLIDEKKRIRRELDQCRRAHEAAGGENELLKREISDGVAYSKNPWQIRRELLNLKGEIRELDTIEDKQNRFETTLASVAQSTTSVPNRKRVPLIPMKK